jgi:alpha-tubulin suppressor-like RCC1 family protein
VVTRARVGILLIVASFFSGIEGCDALFAIDDHGFVRAPLPDAATEGGSGRADAGGAGEGATASDSATANDATAESASADSGEREGEAVEGDATLPPNGTEAGTDGSPGDGGGRDSAARHDSGAISCATNNGGCNPALPCVTTGPGIVACLKVMQLASGDAFNCARLSDGTIRCWGLNQIYELGTTSPPAQSATPLTIANGSGAALSDVVDVAAGAFFACARNTQGAVQCWGDDTTGTLGDRTETSTPTPVTVQIPGAASGVGPGHVHNCATLASGAVECWGGNPYGQLGDGTTTDNLTPVTAIASGATAVAAGDYNTCAIVSGGFVQCWGSNMYGQIGDGTTTDRPTPTTALVAGATAVAVGSGHACALVAGAVECWGRNDVGQLGDGTTTQRSMPITAIAANAVSVSVSSFDYNPAHTCAVLANGAVQCWGSNEFGQLGDGTMTDEYAPETVIASGAAAVTCGTRHTCALMIDGTVRCWGDNQYGATAGSSPTTPVSIPQ